MADLLALMERRGPDDHGVVHVDVNDRTTVDLGHRRLSIIDTSPDGHQPMTRGSLTVTFNGEIYNYVELRAELTAAGMHFRTRSDTEVLLAAYQIWGRECLARLRGMFAFALLDTRTQTLLLARDRFGVKPLFWTMTSTGLAAASTADSLAAVLGCAPDLEYTTHGFQTWSYESDPSSSPYVGVHSVPAGHLAVIALTEPLRSPPFQRWYDLEAEIRLRAGGPAHTMADSVESARSLLHDAVRIRLRSDVPVACSLSSGLDSALLASIVRGRAQLVSFGDPQDSRTEGPGAQQTAAWIGSDVEWINPSGSDMAEALLPTIEAQGGPFAGPSVVAQFVVSRRVRELGFPVLLSGQGADEVFMGYRKFQFRVLADRWRDRRPVGAARQAAWIARDALADRSQWRHLAQAGVRYLGDNDSRPTDARAVGSRPTTTHDWAVRDIETSSLPTLLRYEDRNSMGNSVETRLPYLDHELIAFVLSRPTDELVRHGYGKWILREMAIGALPPQTRKNRSKRGFDAAADRWMSGGMGSLIRSEVKGAPELGPPTTGRHQPTARERYSDQRLVRHSAVFAEAVSRIWLKRWA